MFPSMIFLFWFFQSCWTSSIGAGCEIAHDLKSIRPLAKNKVINLTNHLNPETAITRHCRGLVKYYSKNCVTPTSLSDPGRFVKDWHAFLRLLFGVLTRRFVAIYNRLLSRQKANLSKTILAEMIKFTRKRVQIQMRTVFGRSKTVPPVIQVQLKRSIDAMIRKACLEGLFFFIFLQLLTKTDSEVKQIYTKNKHVFGKMSGLTLMKKCKSKTTFAEKWQLTEWTKVD